jgi:hypothetical protein
VSAEFEEEEAICWKVCSYFCNKCIFGDCVICQF